MDFRRVLFRSVIYIGEHNSVEGMASAVVDEDADIVGVSFSSAAYVEYTRQLVEAMQRKEMGDVPVMLGGIIHPDDHAELKQIGVRGIFGAASQMHDRSAERRVGKEGVSTCSTRWSQ